MVHVPVLLKETIDILNPKTGEFFIDGTAGSGGHSVKILERIGPEGKLLVIDWDKKNIESLKNGIFKNFENVIFVNENNVNLPEILKKCDLPKADGLILDLGFSSEQLEKSGRGFSFLKNEILDMRYNTESEDMTASEIVNSFSDKELADIFWLYGEEKFSRQIAKKIFEERRKKKIITAFDLVEVIKKAVPGNYERGRIHPATRVFQALRIYVNHELENLEKISSDLEKIIKPKGRIAIISFHSLEDRLVKTNFRKLKNEAKAEILTKKPIRPSDEEIRENSRSRSAKLRAIKLN
ncbi:MAG: 16S rRNA (cytosine(1402)-N(4))-methyltransferase RsmH [Patescibacteria group bacterium]